MLLIIIIILVIIGIIYYVKSDKSDKSDKNDKGEKNERKRENKGNELNSVLENIDNSDFFQPRLKKFYNQDNIQTLQKSKIYEDISKLFPNVKFTKIRNEELPGHEWVSIYYALINSMLSSGKRYIILISPIDNLKNGDENTISNIPWINLQTRTFTDIKLPFEMKEQSYTIPSDYGNTILSEQFDIINREKNKKDNGDKKEKEENKKEEEKIDRSVYIAVKLPLKLELLHRGKSVSNYDFDNKIILISGLETFNSILTFT